jgi:transposase
MSKWRHEKAFASWLGLCPNNKVSGERVLSSRSRKVNNRAATTLRLAAMMLGKTDTPLGAFYRRKRAQLGAPKAPSRNKVISGSGCEAGFRSSSRRGICHAAA